MFGVHGYRRSAANITASNYECVWNRDGCLCALCTFCASIGKSFKRIYQFVSSSDPFNAIIQQTMTSRRYSSRNNRRQCIRCSKYFSVNLDLTHSSYNTICLSLFLRQNLFNAGVRERKMNKLFSQKRRRTEGQSHLDVCKWFKINATNKTQSIRFLAAKTFNSFNTRKPAKPSRSSTRIISHFDWIRSKCNRHYSLLVLNTDTYRESPILANVLNVWHSGNHTEWNELITNSPCNSWCKRSWIDRRISYSILPFQQVTHWNYCLGIESHAETVFGRHLLSENRNVIINLLSRSLECTMLPLPKLNLTPLFTHNNHFHE